MVVSIVDTFVIITVLSETHGVYMSSPMNGMNAMELNIDVYVYSDVSWKRYRVIHSTTDLLINREISCIVLSCCA